MITNLFVYGSLMNDEVLEALLSRTFRKSPAELADHLVSSLAGRGAPGMVQRPGAKASGMILHDVDETSFRIICAWEGDDYTLADVRPAGWQGAPCQTFLWNGKAKDKPWDKEAFRQQHLAWYVHEDIPKFLGQTKESKHL